MIDSTIVRAHQHSTGTRKKEGSKRWAQQGWIESENSCHGAMRWATPPALPQLRLSP